MAGAVEITVSEQQRSILKAWTRNQAKTSYRLVERSQIILMSAEGVSNAEQARRLDVDQQRVGRWRRRWAKNEGRLAEAEREGASGKDLAKLLGALLNDLERPGTPATFTAEQLTLIIAVACEPPEDSDIPVTHWTPAELTREVIKRGIVETISPRHIDRLLKGGTSVHTRAATG